MKSLEELADRKILVTGASGFIGSRMLERLRDLNAEMHAVSRDLQSSEAEGPRWHRGDVSDINTVRRILKAAKPELIIHLAGHAAGARAVELILPTLQSNLLSTVNLLTVATEIGCRRIVLVGSLEEPDPASAEAVPSSPYAASKWASSAYARMFYRLYETPVVTARVFMTYGPGQRDLKKLIPYVVLSLLRGQAPRLSSGERLVDWIYVDDVVEGLLVLAQAPNVEGSTLDLGSGTLHSIHDIVMQLVAVTGSQVSPLFGALPERPMEQVRVANSAHTYERVGWEPLMSITEGLEHTVSWYRNALQDPSGPLSK